MAKKRRNKLLDNKILWLVVSLVASLLIWMYLTGTQQEEIVVDLSGVEVVFEGEDSLRDTRGYVIANVDSYRVDVTVRGSRLPRRMRSMPGTAAACSTSSASPVPVSLP